MINIVILLLLIVICIKLAILVKDGFKKLPKFLQYLVFFLSLFTITPIMVLFTQEMLLPCHSKSWLTVLEERVDKDLNKNNPRKVIVINNIRKIYIMQKDTIKIPYKEFESNMNLNYQEQMNKLKTWSYLKYLPKNINKDEYIDYLSRCQYPLFLAMIHFAESSFDTSADNGSYIGLGQHHPDFVRECGYSIKEYFNSWKVQLYVSLEYIKKYVDKPLDKPEQLYAYWLNSNWNGSNKIYCKSSRLPNGKNPYSSNRNLDKRGNNNGCIECDPDLSVKFKNYITN